MMGFWEITFLVWLGVTALLSFHCAITEGIDVLHRSPRYWVLLMIWPIFLPAVFGDNIRYWLHGDDEPDGGAG